MCDDLAVATEVVTLAARLGVRLAAAESLTGGLLAGAIVAVPGASQVFSGGVVAYDTALKASLLGVDPELLRERGPVAGEVAQQMAAGVRRACAVPRRGSWPVVDGGPPCGTPADLGVSTTGVAGPTPDPQSGQAAGTVWLGVSSARGERAVLLEGAGVHRPVVRAAAVSGALELLLEELRHLELMETQRIPGNS